jgi:hypothetical protein
MTKEEIQNLAKRFLKKIGGVQPLIRLQQKSFSVTSINISCILIEDCASTKYLFRVATASLEDKG